jgi:hypothetical protein
VNILAHKVSHLSALLPRDLAPLSPMVASASQGPSLRRS